MKPHVLPTISLALSAGLVSALASPELQTLKKDTEHWIEIRSRLAVERNEWETEKSLLKDSIATLNSSVELIEDTVEANRVRNRNLAKGTAAAKKAVDRLQQTEEILVSRVSEYEARLLGLARRLPPPLADKLQPLLAKISATGSTNPAPTPTRLQNVVAIMTLIDEFNNSLTFANTIKEFDANQAIEARVLYWGLAGGYAIDAQATKAWILAPARDGWTWTSAPQSAPSIKQLFDVYDKTSDPFLVPVPFKLQDDEEDQS